MRFEVHILGCGAALPLPGRNPTAQHINIHEKQFLFDCGEGTQIVLRNKRIRMMRIDHICISHLHGDHYLGLPGLVSTFNLLGRTRPLHVYGPPKLKTILDLHQEAAKAGWISPSRSCDIDGRAGDPVRGRFGPPRKFSGSPSHTHHWILASGNAQGAGGKAGLGQAPRLDSI